MRLVKTSNNPYPSKVDISQTSEPITVKAVDETTGQPVICNWFLTNIDLRSASVIGSLNGPATFNANGSPSYVVGQDPTAPASVQGAAITAPQVAFYPAKENSIASTSTGKLVAVAVSGGAQRELILELHPTL